MTLVWIAIELAGGVLSKAAILDEVRQTDPNASFSDIGALYRSIMVGSLVLGMIGAAFWLWISASRMQVPTGP